MLRIIVFSIILSIATGLTFTLYTDPFGITNMVGHLFQIASFYLIYLAIIETSLTKPQEILFRKLKQNEENAYRERQPTGSCQRRTATGNRRAPAGGGGAPAERAPLGNDTFEHRRCGHCHRYRQARSPS